MTGHNGARRIRSRQSAGSGMREVLEELTDSAAMLLLDDGRQTDMLSGTIRGVNREVVLVEIGRRWQLEPKNAEGELVQRAKPAQQHVVRIDHVARVVVLLETIAAAEAELGEPPPIPIEAIPPEKRLVSKPVLVGPESGGPRP